MTERAAQAADPPAGRVLWYGELTTRARLHRRGLLLVAAATLWVIGLLILPSLVMAAMAFARSSAYGEVEWTLGLDNWRSWSINDARILVRSLWVAAATTGLSLLLAYPLALFVASRRPRTRYLLLGLVMVPFCTNMVVRTYGWMLLLGGQMPVARTLAWLGLSQPGAPLYPSMTAIFIGMVGSFLPFAVLPLYTNIERLDWSIVEAAQDLYGSRWRVFRHGILPQTWPGLSAAIILTFIPAMGTFVISDMLGGSKEWLVGNLIEHHLNAGRNRPMGAAVSLALVALTLVGLWLLRRGRKLEAA